MESLNLRNQPTPPQIPTEGQPQPSAPIQSGNNMSFGQKSSPNKDEAKFSTTENKGTSDKTTKKTSWKKIALIASGVVVGGLAAWKLKLVSRISDKFKKETTVDDLSQNAKPPRHLASEDQPSSVHGQQHVEAPEKSTQQTHNPDPSETTADLSESRQKKPPGFLKRLFGFGN